MISKVSGNLKDGSSRLLFGKLLRQIKVHLQEFRKSREVIQEEDDKYQLIPQVVAAEIRIIDCFICLFVLSSLGNHN